MMLQGRTSSLTNQQLEYNIDTELVQLSFPNLICQSAVLLYLLIYHLEHHLLRLGVQNKSPWRCTPIKSGPLLWHRNKRNVIQLMLQMFLFAANYFCTFSGERGSPSLNMSWMDDIKKCLVLTVIQSDMTDNWDPTVWHGLQRGSCSPSLTGNSCKGLLKTAQCAPVLRCLLPKLNIFLSYSRRFALAFLFIDCCFPFDEQMMVFVFVVFGYNHD